MIYKFARWVPAFFWMAFIYYLSSKSKITGPEIPDYVAHFILYGLLSAFYLLGVSGHIEVSGSTGLKIVFVVLVMTSLYSLSDEIHQSFVPGRTPELTDWLVDSFAGFIIPYAIIRLKL